MARDDFKQSIITQLEKSVGSLCSNPQCRQSTRAQGINIGVAAHICAASQGGPRYNPNMTSEERSSFENGIWLCQNCAKMIDSLPERYPETLLKKWKTTAESEALSKIEAPTKHITSQFSGKIPIEGRNKLIAAAKIALKAAEFFAENPQIEDTNAHQFCNELFYAVNELRNLEYTYHLQLHDLGLDEIIESINEMMPETYVYDPLDVFACAELASASNCIKFFCYSDDDAPQKFMNNCRQIIAVIENL